ncbi:MAG: FAD/NAD(P)-binding oxidoreductase [Chloroflexota bacterium]
MKTLLILGAGTGGTMVANKMTNLLDTREWRIVIVDKEETHYYQPGFLFIPFGIYQPTDVVKPKSNFFPKSAEVIYADIELIEPEKNRVKLSGNKTISYDYLVVATGSHIHPEETDGMMDGWQKNVFDFYTPQGAANLHKFLETWNGGRLVLNVAEMPIKCPVAPLEFLFLADWYFNQRGIRNKVELTFATPLSGAFTKPVASKMLGNLMERKGISVVPDFNIMEVDNSKNTIRSYDEIEVPFDVFISIPVNKGAEVIGASGMGDSLNFIPTNKNTLQTEKWENIFIIGDAGDVPSSKAGSVAHFMLDILVDNLLDHMKGHEMKASFDGHANCFIESGYNKGLLIDFNFEVEPLPGTFPFAGVGPFRLLQESYLNHIGKMGFRWIYWNILLKGYDLPFVETHMSMNGKQVLVQEPA